MKNLSTVQEAIWLTQNIYTGSSLYNVGGYAFIEGELNAPILIRSIEEVLDDADVIEIGYNAFNDAVLDNNAGFIKYDISTIDYSSTPDPDQSCLNWMHTDINEIFDVNSSLIKIRVLKSGNNRHYWYAKVHHLIFDGYSMSLFFNNVSAIYSASISNAGEPVEGRKYQYADFIKDDIAYRLSDEFKDDQRFWLNRVKNLPPSKAFQSCMRSIDAGSMVSRRKEARIPRDLYDQIDLFCKGRGCTVFHYFISAITVINKLYNNEPLVTGLPVFNRRTKGFKNTLGTFVNILPFSILPEEGATFIEILDQVKHELNECYKHQRFALYDILDALGGKGNVYNITFSYQKNIYEARLGGLASSISYMHCGEQQEDLVFHLLEYSATGDLTLSIDYKVDLFSGEVITGLLDHFVHLLFSLLHTPYLPVHELAYLNKKETQQLLTGLNNTATDFPLDKTIVDLFGIQVKKHPDKIALVFEETELSYKELNEWSNQLGHYLRKTYKIRPDDLVGIKLERSEWMIIGMLGVLKSGGAYVPIDPEYPKERIGFMLSDSGCKAVIDEEELAAFIRTKKKYSRKNTGSVNKPTDLMYVMYTSGSTGHPKGCMLEHRGLINRMEWMWRHFGFSADDIILQKTTFTFDVSVGEIFMPLCWGAKMVLCTKEDARSPERILFLVKKQGITSLHFVPGMLNAFIPLLADDSSLPRSVWSLRRIFTSGDALLPDVVRRWYDKTAIPLYNLYGPTEASIEVTYYATSPKDNKIPIGRPIWNTQIYITGRSDQLLPAGVVGEICIGGAGLARGYLNKPELTAAKFITNPFKDGGRIYKTGDLGKWLPDGNIEFVGRMDDQVKIRGYRVELGEIDSAIQSHPDVVSAAVIAIPNQHAEKELVAYIAGREGLHTGDIRSYLLKTLPDYMIPGHFIRLEALPVTSNGKVDKKKLPDLAGLSMSAGIEYIAPLGRTEEKLALIWQAILGKEKVGRKDDFFGSGGHSLKATRLASQIHKEFEVKVGLKDLFARTVLEEQALLIREAKKLAFAPIMPAGAQSHYPVSPAQRRLWVLSQFEAGSTAYNMAAAYIMEGPLDPGSLQHAFDRLIERHEILRTVFREDRQGNIRQFILSPEETGFRIGYRDLRWEEEQEKMIAGLTEAAFVRPFDLSDAPLLRAELYQVSEKKWVFVYAMHHIISDGWSMGILMKELILFYSAHSKGESLPLPPLRIHYKDYATWQQVQLAGSDGKAHMDYWMQLFKGELPVLELPGDKPRPAIKTYNGRTFRKRLDSQSYKGIKDLSQEQGATLFMGLMAIVNVLLYRYTQQEDIIIGSPMAGREHADLEDQIGLFVNTLAIRTQFKGENSFKELLKNIQRVTLEAYAHQEYPFDELVDALVLQRDMSRNALFDVMVVLRNAADHNFEGRSLGEIKISEYAEAVNPTSKFDLTFTFEESGEEWEILLEYNSDIYARHTITRLADHLEQLIRTVIEHPSGPVCHLEYLGEKEKQQLLKEFNDTAVAFPEDKTIMDLFEERVNKNPDDIAVIFEGVELTYKELNERSNQLGGYLQKKYEIRPDDLVGIKLDRSEWMIIAILGVLKSGGAYLPMDPAYPQERIGYMQEDSRCKVLLDERELSMFRQEKDIYEKNNLSRINGPDDLIYVIYTSGSTGRPKGAMVKQHSFVNLALWYGKALELDHKDCTLLMAPVSFDLAQKNIFTTLIYGARLCLPIQLYGDYAALAETICQKEVTVVNAAPSAFYPLLDETVNAGFKKLSTLKKVVLGGEPIVKKELIDWVRSGLFNGKLINSYGPTECTDVVSFHVIDNNEWEVITDIPIGMPVDNCDLYILDNNRELVPVGITGEVFVSGICVGRGYLHQPELTADKFVSDPFKEGVSMYKTGDLGRWLPDGNIRYLGRKDNQVKVRGHRVELGEIEHALQTHPDISSGVVIARPRAVREMELVAYIVSRHGLNRTSIRSFLTGILPHYMVPDHFVQMDALPLTPSGKIDRKRLPDPEGAGMFGTIAYVAPGNRTEEALVSIWQEILGKEKIGVKDNFFELGGHSLKAVRLVSRINKTFLGGFTIQDIFSEPTIENIGKRIDLIDSSGVSFNTSIPRSPARSDYPLSSAQRRIWVLSQLGEGNLAYNISGVYLLEGDLDAEALSYSFQRLAGRHEILRTIFGEDERQELRQFIKSPEELPFTIPFTDLRGQAGIEEKVDSLLREELARPFNLFTGPLIRAILCRTGDDKWVFIYLMHHIISDGWSMNILVQELLLFYNSYVNREPDSLLPLRIQYKDYAVWQQERLRNGDFKAAKEYWTRQFDGGMPLLQLATDKARPRIRTYHGEVINRVIDPGLYKGMQAISQEQDATLFMGLLATVNALLYRYTDQEDIVIGTPIAGREHIDLEDQIGLYINTLALRIRFTGEDSFRALLENVKKTAFGAYEHQVYPFDELVDELGLQRDMSRNPLFDVMMVLQDSAIYDIEQRQGLGGLKVTGYKGSDQVVSKFDLLFTFEETGERLRLRIEYNSDLYNRNTADRLANHLVQLIAAIIANPSTPVQQLDYLSEKEKRQLLVEFNDTAVDYPRDATIVDLFEEQARKTPGNTAVAFEDKSLTYKELDDRSGQLALYLRTAYDVLTGDRIGIVLDRSEMVILAILAVLKAGAVYVPIDPAYPAARKKFIIRDAGINVLITHSDDTTDLDHYEGRVFSIGGRPVISDVPVRSPEVQIYPDSPAYVMYTSGSMGMPKGVIVEHGGVVRLVKSANYIDLTGEEVLLSTGAPSFDATTFEFWGMLLNGGKLIICPKEVLLSEDRLAAEIRENGVTTMWFTSGWLNQLVDKDPGIFAGLRTLLAGGDRLSPAHINILLLRYPGLRIINGYGPTENTTFSLTYPVSAPLENIPVGKPISNSTAYVIDSRQQLVPVGVIGEICVGGVGLARGYLNKPQLTTERFVANPFKEGERIYRTGDLGRWLPDGNIEFEGRTDEQVKIRGFRVEPEEIERTLQSHPDIDSAVVVARFCQNDEKELVAYVVSKGTINIGDLQKYIAGTLPHYMVPNHFVRVEALPLTVNGKVDKRKLPDPDGPGMSAGAEYIAPRNKVEEKLVGIWQELLGKMKVGVRDDFFELGGHSLKVTRLASQIYKVFAVKLTFNELFTRTTAEDQAQLIMQVKKTIFSGIPPAARQPHYPLSSSQRRLWVLSQFEDGNTAYNMPGAYVMEGNLDQGALEYAFAALIERHEILRTVFKEDEQEDIRQFIRTPEETGFRIISRDLEQEAVQELVEASFTQPFDLSAGPLLRAELYRVSGNKWVLAYVMHHIAGDGWSMGILIDELMVLYNTRLRGEENPLPRLPIQYKDFATWQQNQMAGESLMEDRAYWVRQFEGEIPVLALPGDRIRPAIKSYKGAVIRRKLSPELVKGIKDLSRDQGGTLFMGLLAAINTLLYRYTNQEDIIIGSPIAGREHIDLEGQLGFYVNTLALRSRFRGENSYRELFDNIRQTTLDAYRHQAYPFDELVDTLDLRRDMSRSALFDVMVILQNAGAYTMEERSVGGLKVTPYEGIPEAVSKFDLVFDFAEAGDAIQARIEYNSDIYEKQTIERLADHLEQLLQAIVKHPETPINQLNYLGEEERQQLLSDFNDTGSEYPRDITIIDLFEEQVNKTPGKTALVFQEVELTYKELNERANQMGDYLRKKYRIDPDDLVGIKLDRNEWLITAILGVLKSGGAYVPIDPDYPEERIGYMLKDSKCKVLIDASELTTFLHEKNKYSRKNIRPVNKPDDLAYVIYTSGSTGFPKGVMIGHGNTCAFIHWCKNEFKNAVYDVVLGVTSVCFDLSVFEIFYTLSIGKKLMVLKNALSVSQYLHIDEKILLNTVPGVVDMLLNEHANLGSISVLNMAGEPIPERCLSRLDPGKMEIRNLYGPSETTTYSTRYRISDGSSALIGRPIANTQLYILDESVNLQPMGVAGEICISGAGLARGYLNQPELTAAKFVANPFKEGERMYRTGDIGRWLSDGNIAFIGRKDNQVKIRGYRIELGEIGKVLQNHPDIHSAIVLARSNVEYDKSLVAYIISEKTISIPELRSHVGKTLPAYMIPGYFVLLESFPLTLNGKIDKRRLPDPDGSGIPPGAEYIPPRDAMEEKLVLIWRDLLSRADIGIRDDFFALGGHSLTVIRLAGRIHKEFQVKIALKELFAVTEPEGQARLIRKAKNAVYTGISQAPIQELYELSPSQQRLWLMHKMGIDKTAYNMYGIFDPGENIDVDLFKQSIKQLIDRHEILRTQFVEIDGLPWQKVMDGKGLLVDMDLVDLTNEQSPASAEREIRRKLANHPFSLNEWPLIRLTLIKTKEAYRLLYSMHHIITDGWSMEIFAKDIQAIYRSALTGGLHSLPALSTQYKDYANWQNDLLRNERMKEQEQYWRLQLDGILPALQLPGDHEWDDAGTDDRARSFRLIIDKDLKNKTGTFLLSKKVSLFALFIACFKVVLHRITGETDIIIGVPVANRDHDDVKNLIGFFLNTIMLRDRIEKGSNFETFLEQVNTTLLNGLENQSYPFEKVLEKLNIRGDHGHPPISSIFLNMLNFNSTEKESLSGLLSGHGEEVFSAKFDLECYFREYADGISIECAYRICLFKEETIGYWINEFVSVIRQVVERPSIEINRIDIFSAAVIRTPAPGPVNAFTYFEDDAINQSIVSRFEEQAQRFPESIAIAQDDETISYSELNALANGLAAGIAAAGRSGKGNIALLLEHGKSAIIGILGVLKSGNMYVPLDPDLPPGRLLYILREAKCRLVIVSAQTVRIAEALLIDLPDARVIDISRKLKTVAENPGLAIPPESGAYILYTSGSTGEPKGVVQTHRNVLHFIRVYTNNLHIDRSDRLSLLPAYGFDASVSDLYSALLNGASIHPYDLKRKAIGALPGWLRDSGITVMHIVPTIYRYFITALKGEAFSTVRLLVLGGEAIYKHDFEKFKTYFPEGAFLVNTYGPTESSTVLQHFLDHHSMITRRSIPVGRPVQDTRVYLLNEDNEQAGIYQVGEIIYKSDYLSPGYLNKEELTGSVFITDPVTKSGRVYRSGDFGRMLPTGEIEFVGRKDNQVKLNGQRVELSGIEQSILGIEGVREAAVLLKTVAAGEKLVAYIRSDHPIDHRMIRQRLSGILPHFMIPAICISLDKFPLTPTGKISRTALPELTGKEMGNAGYIAPRNEMEERLVSIWQELLSKEQIGVQDDFFELGGNSLKATQLISRINMEFLVQISIQVVFKEPTIENISGHISFMLDQNRLLKDKEKLVRIDLV